MQGAGTVGVVHCPHRQRGQHGRPGGHLHRMTSQPARAFPNRIGWRCHPCRPGTGPPRNRMQSPSGRTSDEPRRHTPRRHLTEPLRATPKNADIARQQLGNVTRLTFGRFRDESAEITGSRDAANLGQHENPFAPGGPGRRPPRRRSSSPFQSDPPIWRQQRMASRIAAAYFARPPRRPHGHWP